MLIYEKNNKLNINFDNEISENPDLQIGKEDGKTEVLIDGEPSGGGSGGLIVEFTYVDGGSQYDKFFRSVPTAKQVRDAYLSGRPVIFHFPVLEGWFSHYMYSIMGGITYANDYIRFDRFVSGNDNSLISCDSKDITDLDSEFEWHWYID